MLVLCAMKAGNKTTLTQEHIRNAKEYYDYFVNIDSNEAAFYERLIELKGTEVNNRTSNVTIKDVSLTHVVTPLKRKPLRERKPKSGFTKTIAEIIEEILIEKDRSLTAKELLASIYEKGRKVGELKDF